MMKAFIKKLRLTFGVSTVTMILSSFSLAAPSAPVVSKIVGKVGEYSLTSREVLGGLLLEKALTPEVKGEIVENVNAAEFVPQVSSALIEKVVSLEAENFSLATISEEERKESTNKVKKNLANVRLWQKLTFTEAELQDFLLRKLRSKKFLKYKSEVASLTVSEFEVKDYFEKNRYKFGNLPMDSFKESIRQYLIQKQSEDRLREWFEVLRKKYQVRNYMAESSS